MVAVCSIVLVAMCFPGRDSAPARRVTIALLACATWWFVAAALHGRTASFLPLGASFLGFAAAFVVIRSLTPTYQVVSARVVATAGACAAAVGLVACALRWYPLAISSQGLWRLATTLTYSDAAGLLLGIAALIGLALDDHAWWARLDVALCVAGLVATQSRGAVVAALIGVAFVPWRTIARCRWPLLAGVGAGVLVVATSPGPHARPWVVAGAAVVIAAGVLVQSPWRVGRLTRRRAVVLGACALGVALVVAGSLHTPVDRRVQLASTSARLSVWRAALDQWGSSPWTGVGPDATLHLGGAHDEFAHFAHDEFLQVGAGSGAVGELLLLASVATVAAAVRRVDTLSSCAVGALVTFTAAATVDFDWHLAALGILGGWAAGLADGAAPDLPLDDSPAPESHPGWTTKAV